MSLVLCLRVMHPLNTNTWFSGCVITKSQFLLVLFISQDSSQFWEIQSQLLHLWIPEHLWNALLERATYHHFARNNSRTLLMHQGELFHVVRLAPTPVLNRRWHISDETPNLWKEMGAFFYSARQGWAGKTVPSPLAGGLPASWTLTADMTLRAIFNTFQLLTVGFGTHSPLRLLHAAGSSTDCWIVTSLAGVAPAHTQSLCKGCRISPALIVLKKSMNLRHTKDSWK